jgi:hypothetical protein
MDGDIAPLNMDIEDAAAQERLPSSYFESPFLTSRNLLVWRWTATILCVGMIAWSASTPYYILFFTHWAWIGMAIYFLVHSSTSPFHLCVAFSLNNRRSR